MNAKDYGVAQNRERVFMLSVRRDLGLPAFKFPSPLPLTKEVSDYLEETDDLIYFLSPENVIKFLQINETDKNGEFIYAETDHRLSEQEIQHYRNQNYKKNESNLP